MFGQVDLGLEMSLLGNPCKEIQIFFKHLVAPLCGDLLGEDKV